MPTQHSLPGRRGCAPMHACVRGWRRSRGRPSRSDLRFYLGIHLQYNIIWLGCSVDCGAIYSGNITTLQLDNNVMIELIIILLYYGIKTPFNFLVSLFTMKFRISTRGAPQNVDASGNEGCQYRRILNGRHCFLLYVMARSDFLLPPCHGRSR